ncbi:MAG: hypothetical protein PHW34_12900 [Hespellia sp.]|nr:hypothetical protein [Hespellia sp.]
MNGKRKIWTVCTMLVLVFVVSGIFYYYYETSHANTENEGTLIMETRPGQLWQ